MPVNRRTALLAYVLAIPVLIAVYASTFGTRLWAALRPGVATFLGATVIGSVYAHETLKRAPTSPMRAAAALALAVALVTPGMAPAPVSAAGDPAENVIAAARQYLDFPFKLGTEGPKLFDCSGLIYRAFADAGELPRIGGMRLRAAGYMRWFIARGHFTKQADKARRGDLVVWDKGDHIGIYLGDGKAISALINPWGVTIHSLGGIHQDVDYFLHVNWGNGNGDGDPGPGEDPGPGDGGDPPGDGGPGPGNGNNPGTGPGNGDPPPDPGPGDGENPPPPDPGENPPPDPGPGSGENPGANPEQPPADGADGNAGDDTGTSPNATGPRANAYGPPADNGTPPQEPTGNGAGEPDQPPANTPSGTRSGHATGTLNMRLSADPESRIVGWVSRGTQFRILGKGTSPGGWLWYEVQLTSGRTGWLFGHWVRQA